jgi:hypothetical protein
MKLKDFITELNHIAAMHPASLEYEMMHLLSQMIIRYVFLNHITV